MGAVLSMLSNKLLKWHEARGTKQFGGTFPEFFRWGFMIEAQVRIGAVAHGDDQCVMNGFGAPGGKNHGNPMLRIRRCVVVVEFWYGYIGCFWHSATNQLRFEESSIFLGKVLYIRSGARFFPVCWSPLNFSLWMRGGSSPITVPQQQDLFFLHPVLLCLDCLWDQLT